jgi:4-hydroxy-tetrahydrodipicolinate reductase
VIKVGVFGAIGRMGSLVCETIEADPDLELVARVDPNGGEAPESLVSSGADVAVDFTHPEKVLDNIAFCCRNGVHAVVGTSGFSAEKLGRVSELVSEGRANVFIAPNFSIGAVLMMQFAKQAAPFMASCEIIELHHNQKLDAPSGTSTSTAELVAGAWRERGRPGGGGPAEGEFEVAKGARGGTVDEVRVHSVRLRGLLAHQEVLFGSQGETLTIRHDTMERSSFMPGVLLAVKSIASRPGLTVGLENLLGL